MTTPQSSREFVAGLVREIATLFSQLSDRETLESEADGQVDVITLLKLAMRSEVEAAEIAGLWLSSTPELDVKAAFAQQCADEMKHYELIRQRLLELGEPAEELEVTAEHTPLYVYLTNLRTTVERVAAGPFAREAVAEVRNRQFIELCEATGDLETAKLYIEVIQPEEVHHNRLGRDLLIRYATTPELQRKAAEATRTSLAIADELRTLTEKTTGLHPIPVS
ncbi:MAG TPA: ferritin-like domain-containing protein [Thermoanaerobaculia bacterium]|nr:ferritin-like domain-containing protein [Thermoanaerobaculia bacterium]